jgi:hypothetical protein
MLFALLKEAGLYGRGRARVYASDVLGFEVTSFKELDDDDAGILLGDLERILGYR